ncbi:MAG: lipase family protein [Salibacteraceae bacterium]
MKRGFELAEAREMLGLAYAADLLGPAGFDKRVIDWKKDYSTKEANPLKDDDGCHHPYPEQVWPEGWTPGLPDATPWERSVIVPTLLKGGLEGIARGILKEYDVFGLSKVIAEKCMQLINSDKEVAEGLKLLAANNAVVTYNADRNAYAIAFAGTQNIIGGLEDLIFLPVSAGPIVAKGLGSPTTYMYQPDPQNLSPVGKVHLGFRLAVEQFTINAAKGESLIEALMELNKQARGKDAQGRLRLYITGHSLGAAMGSLFTAWLQANSVNAEFKTKYPGFPELDLKMYTFATPKTGSDHFLKAFNMGLTNAGKAFHVDNHLDAVPDIPFTVKTLYTFSNPDMLTKMFAKEGEPVNSGLTAEEIESEIEAEASPEKKKGLIRNWIQKIAAAPFAATGYTIAQSDYGHIGSPIHIRGSYPLAAKSEEIDGRFFPGDHQPRTSDISSPKIIKLWWQHWPWVYREALDNTFAEE